jgi:hypothetical protein
VPFHRQGEHPRAPCPQCQEKGDDELKDLFGLRGLGEGEYDINLPPEWRQCPPIKLDASIPGMEAVRFQYMSLIRYAQKTSVRWKRAQYRQDVLLANQSKERKQRRQAQAELQDLQAKVTELEVRDAKLRKWESRSPMITKYLGNIKDMAE